MLSLRSSVHLAARRLPFPPADLRCRVLFTGFEIFLAGSAPFDVSNFFASYILIPLYIGAYFFWKFYKKTSIVTYVPLTSLAHSDQSSPTPFDCTVSNRWTSRACESDGRARTLSEASTM